MVLDDCASEGKNQIGRLWRCVNYLKQIEICFQAVNYYLYVQVHELPLDMRLFSDGVHRFNIGSSMTHATNNTMRTKDR